MRPVLRPHALFLLLAAIFTGTTITACQGSEQDPIRIGATMSLSGAYSTQGTAARNGYVLCEEHLNADAGLLGRQVEFLIHDDASDGDTASTLYEQLISEEGVDAIMGPYGSTLTEAVAPITERYEFVHVSPLAATSSIWEQGREYLFMVLPPAELFLAGLIDMAAEQGLERVAVLQEDQLFPRAAGDGAAELANQNGMDLILHRSYASGTDDFSEILKEMADAQVQVLAMAASNLDDFITVTRQLKEMDISPTMFGTSGAVEEYMQAMGPDGNYSYGLSAWEPGLPNPGMEEFVAAYEARFDRAPSFHSAGAYGSCQLFAEAITRAGSLDSEQIRQALLAMETTTVFGEFAVDQRGYQIANQGVFIQWQDGEKVVVWPEELATASPRFPTPSWDERE